MLYRTFLVDLFRECAMQCKRCVVISIGTLLLAGASAGVVQAQAAADDELDSRANSSELAKQLSSAEAIVRQRAAEALARLAAVEQKKLVEGYLLEEKDKRVRLALNWAVYRMGKSPALFQIVRDLDSSRHDQAAGYLTQLEGPQPLYIFLKPEEITTKVTVRLLEVLGQIGNAETIAHIRPFTTFFDPKLAGTAQLAISQIEHRLAQPQPAAPTRPRSVRKPEQSSP